MTTYVDYTDGHLTPMQALRALVMEYGEVESELTPLEEQRARLREQIGMLLTRIDNEKAEIKGFGTVRLVGPGVAEKWDGKALEQYAEELRAAGNSEIADSLMSCKGKTMRAGGLRIERSR